MVKPDSVTLLAVIFTTYQLSVAEAPSMIVPAAPSVPWTVSGLSMLTTESPPPVVLVYVPASTLTVSPAEAASTPRECWVRSSSGRRN